MNKEILQLFFILFKLPYVCVFVKKKFNLIFTLFIVFCAVLVTLRLLCLSLNSNLLHAFYPCSCLGCLFLCPILCLCHTYGNDCSLHTHLKPCHLSISVFIIFITLSGPLIMSWEVLLFSLCLPGDRGEIGEIAVRLHFTPPWLMIAWV